MSFIASPGSGVLKRSFNVFMFEQAAGGPTTNKATLNPTFASMTFSAAYLAAFPAAVQLGGTLDPAQLGPNGILSNGNLTVEFTGVSGVMGTVVYAGVPPVAWEWVIQCNGNPPFEVGEFDNGGPPFNSGANLSGQAAFADFVNSNGVAAGIGPGVPTPIVPFVNGDIVGFVLDVSGGTGLHVFKNGVQVTIIPYWNNITSCAAGSPT